MPTVYDIEQALFRWAPKETAMHGDNVGHLVGKPAEPVERVLVALDITYEVVMEAIREGIDLIVSHHPVMNCTWNPVQTIRNDDRQGKILMALVENRIAAICMHTNLDAAAGGVNDVLAARLGIQKANVIAGGEGVVRAGELAEETPLQDFLSIVRERLTPNGIRYVDGGKVAHRVAVGGGACGEFFRCAADAGCDTFVTSDVKYNQFLDARDLGLNLIDAGHFPTEDCVCSAIIEYLIGKFPMLMIKKSTSHREIIQYYI